MVDAIPGTGENIQKMGWCWGIFFELIVKEERMQKLIAKKIAITSPLLGR